MNTFNAKQLKRLIQEVIREVESEEEPLPASAAHQKQFGKTDPILSLTLGGMNKKNAHIVKDFIAQMAYEAKKKDLELIHAQLESQGKLGLELDKGEIQKSEAEINAELDKIAANIDPDEMTPAQRLAQIKPGERAGEWEKATANDAETQKINARKRAAVEKAGTLQLDPETGLPADTNLWTDKDWELWDTGQKSTGNQSYRKASSIKGQKAAVPADFSQKLKH
jgi:RNA binding exosome subunit